MLPPSTEIVAQATIIIPAEFMNHESGIDNKKHNLNNEIVFFMN